MARARPALIAFNRGLLSTSGLARVDIERVKLSAEEQTNWMPRVLGSMTLRPGLEYTGATKDNNQARQIPFVFSTDDTADIELTANVMRVWVDDELITRPTVTAAVTNGTFDTDLTGWTDSDEGGSASTWATGGYMSLVGTGTLSAIRDQEITVNEPSTEHALRIVITRGTIILKLGIAQGDGSYIETLLGRGTHSVSLTPTANFWIRVQNVSIPASLINNIEVEAAGVMEIPTPWTAAHLDKVRRTQSGDIIFVATDGLQQRQIERRSTSSWSVVLYEPGDGPFRILNIDPITITPTATTGDTTLTASKEIFKSTHVGALFRLTQTGQSATADISAEDTFTDDIRISGIGGGRAFTISVTGIIDSTVTLQRSVGAPGDWVDVEQYTVTTVKSFNDELDNQIIYYRLGIKSGDYGTDTCTCLLSYSSGSQTGIARVTAFTSSTVVSAAVLDAFGNTTAATDWNEGTWSDFRGYPSSVAIDEGRLWWFGKDLMIASISDAFLSFDDTFEGDAGTIQRSIGSGPVDTINWAMSLNRLLIGTENDSANIDAVRADANSSLAIKSSSFDEPITPTNFSIKASASTGFYVDRSGQRVWQLLYGEKGFDYQSQEVTITVPDLFEGGISHIALQQKPEMRLHCIKSDGTMGVLIYDIAENVKCWVEIETDGIVEDVSVRPGTEEDQVYYIVRRVINGSVVRYREKFALESECRGGSVNKQADAFILYNGPSTTAITGLSHLEDEEVVVWGNGKFNGTYTVSSGAITLNSAISEGVIGLGYQARYKSVKLAYGASNGTSLLLRKRISEIGVILENTHYQGLQYGQDLDHLEDLPTVEDGVAVPADTVWDQYDKDEFPFNGEWTTDARLFLVANAPKPATVLAGVLTIETSDRG